MSGASPDSDTVCVFPSNHYNFRCSTLSFIRTFRTTVAKLDKTNILKPFWRPSLILLSFFSLFNLAPYLISTSMHFFTYLPSFNIVEKVNDFSLTAALSEARRRISADSSLTCTNGRCEKRRDMVHVLKLLSMIIVNIPRFYLQKRIYV